MVPQSQCFQRKKPSSAALAASMTATITQNACRGAVAREGHVHPEDAREQRQRQQRRAEDGEDPEDVVLAVRDHRLVRRLEPLDDLLVVVEQVPDPLGGVDDVVEVEVELLGQEPLDAALEHAQRRSLRLDDLPVADDLLLHVREVADDVLGAPLEHVVLDRVELVPDLVEDREAVVEEVVEHLVQEPAGPLREAAPRAGARPPRAGGRGARRGAARRSASSRGSRGRGRRRARPRSAAGSSCRRRGSGGRRRGTPGTRRPSGAAASRARPRRRARASRSARRARAPPRRRAARDEPRSGRER